MSAKGKLYISQVSAIVVMMLLYGRGAKGIGYPTLPKLDNQKWKDLMKEGSIKRKRLA